MVKRITAMISIENSGTSGGKGWRMTISYTYIFACA